MIANPRAATVSKRVQQPDIVRLYPLLLPDGSVRNVHIVARVPRDESGNAELVGAVMDIIEHHSSRATLCFGKSAGFNFFPLVRRLRNRNPRLAPVAALQE